MTSLQVLLSQALWGDEAKHHKQTVLSISSAEYTLNIKKKNPGDFSWKLEKSANSPFYSHYFYNWNLSFKERKWNTFKQTSQILQI